MADGNGIMVHHMLNRYNRIDVCLALLFCNFRTMHKNFMASMHVTDTGMHNIFTIAHNLTAAINHGLPPSFRVRDTAHDKTNKIACAPSEDTDQPGHPSSLIRVFAVRSMGS